ncbi:PQQ-binding-like beta-propeller repeat protein [Nannocystis pusilla]|uniref:outer membrane protein assembly factor BamB family protein n=1 Tax=Nannocystis pusilla TaxID=889268 RepID=UPI003B7F2D0E
MSIPARILAFTGLALSACFPSVLVGENPLATDGPESSTGLESSTGPEPSTGAPTSGDPGTGEPSEAVCGDGVVDGDEACDDGNDEPNDGCGVNCTRTGEVAWTVEGAGWIEGFATGPDGTIYLCTFGVVNEPAFVRAFTPDGTELWSSSAPHPGEIAVSPTGQIFLANPVTGIHTFNPDGALVATWDPFPDVGIFGLAAADDALYVGTGDPEIEGQLVVHRLDLATGEPVWEAHTPEGITTIPEQLVIAGDRLLVPGYLFNDEGRRSMLAAFDRGTGEMLSLELADPAAPAWSSLAVFGDGDLALAGRGLEPDGLLVRRLTADLEEAWTDFTPYGTGTSPRPEKVAAGPQGHVAVVGYDAGDNDSAIVRLLDGEGATLWSSRFASPQDNERDGADGVAFGPDYLVVGGSISTEDEGGHVTSQWWLRRFVID